MSSEGRIAAIVKGAQEPTAAKTEEVRSPKKRRAVEEDAVDSPVKRLRASSVSATLAALSSADPAYVFAAAQPKAPLFALEAGYVLDSEESVQRAPALSAPRSLSQSIEFYSKGKQSPVMHMRKRTNFTT